METKQIEAGNRLIAEFIGFREYIDEPKFRESDLITYHKYHSSWDWLMPVVQKIFKTDMHTMEVYTLYVSDALRTADIEQVYDAVVDFIHWYNSVNK